jgi:acetoin utilization protein AcuB
LQERQSTKQTRRSAANGKHPDQLLVADVATREVLTCNHHESLDAAERIMIEAGKSRLVIVCPRGAASERSTGGSVMNTSAVMTRSVVVVSPNVTVRGAARTMERLHIRHLPVVEGGRLVGILSDRDLLKHAPDAKCSEAMSVTPVTCSPDATVSRVAELMLERKIDSVPVVGLTGKLVGLVTSTDLLGLLIDRAQAQVLPFDFQLRIAASDQEAVALAE